ncbi:MAG: HlyD family efflux transporter periplasmic adaptor subunit [Limisphaerales bacterium]
MKKANVEAAQANLQRLEDLRDFGRVTAPFPGTITMRNTDIGQLIAADSGPELFRLAQTSPLRVYVRVPQQYIPAIKPGQKAELVFQEAQGKIFPATITRTAGAVDPGSRTLLVELQVDNFARRNSCRQLRASPFQRSRQRQRADADRQCADFPRPGNASGRGGMRTAKCNCVPVTLGRDFGNTVEILSGLETSDRVINNPPDSIAERHGSKNRDGDRSQFKQMKIASPTRARLEAGNWQRIAVRIHKPTIFAIPVTPVSSSMMAKPKILKQALSLATLLVGMVSFVGCAIGPNYHRPAPLPTESAPKTFSDGSTNQVIWKIAEPSAHVPRGEWWQLFGDAELNRLQSLALTNNQNLVAAAAQLEQARALVAAARSEFFPQITAGGTPNGDITRQRTSVNQPQSGVAAGTSHTYDTFTAPAVSWLGIRFMGPRAPPVARRSSPVCGRRR